MNTASPRTKAPTPRAAPLIYAFAALLIAAAWAASPEARAHISRPIPWHPLALNYRNALFLLTLEPRRWSEIDLYLHAAARAVDAKIPAKVEAAAAEKDAPALADALAADLFQRISRLLDQGQKPAPRGQRQQALSDAQALNRTFADLVRLYAPSDHARAARLWLELTSATTTDDNAAYRKANSELQALLRRHLNPPKGPSIAARPLLDEDFDGASFLPAALNLADPNPEPTQLLNIEKRGLPEERMPLVALGDALFSSPSLLGNPARALSMSCATCHSNGSVTSNLFFPGLSNRASNIDVDGGFFNHSFNDHRFDPIDTPSLRGIRFTAPYGRDGRSASLGEFTRNVITLEFAGDEPTPLMLDALVAYMNEFDFLPNSNLGRDHRLSSSASKAAQRGQVLFSRTYPRLGACADCHNPRSFFTDGRSYELGSGKPGYEGERIAFETPSLLGSANTAPYFHDGTLPTLASVVAWFDSSYRLGMSRGERMDLTAYLEAVGAEDDPWEDGGESARLGRAFAEIKVFARALEPLLKKRQAREAQIVGTTIATELRLDFAAVGDLELREALNRMAELMTQLTARVKDHDWGGAQRAFSDYRHWQQQAASHEAF